MKIKQISKKYEVKMSGIIEDLKLRKMSSHKYVDNVETKYNKRNLVDMSDDKDSFERYEISKNYGETFTDVDEEIEGIDQI